jgi:hypothetical protein
MIAGKSRRPVGTRVRLKNITDEYDADMNGRIGTLARPFHGFPIRDVGVILDPLNGDGKCIPATVYLNEIEVIDHE